MRQQKAANSLDDFLKNEQEYPAGKTCFPDHNWGHESFRNKLNDLVENNFKRGTVGPVQYFADENRFYVAITCHCRHVPSESQEWAKGISCEFRAEVGLERGGSATDFIKTIAARIDHLEAARSLLWGAYIRDSVTACEDI
jgi:hypothetical protein